MQFDSTGLPQTQTIKDAFAIMTESVRDDVDLQRVNGIKQIDKQLEGRIQQWEEKNPNASESERQQHLAQIEQIRNMSIDKMNDDLASTEMLAQRKLVDFAKFAGKFDAQEKELVVAAALVTDCTHSPLDFMMVKDRLGDGVANVVGELQHLAAYKHKSEQLIQTMSNASKLINLAKTIRSIGLSIKKINNLMPGQQVQLSRRNIKNLFNRASSFFNVSPTADNMFMEAFNTAYDSKVNAGLRVERGENGRLMLTDDQRKKDMVLYPENPKGIFLPHVEVGPNGKIKGGPSPRL